MSLSREDLAVLDRYVEQAGLDSRSAGVQHAIRRLQDPQLEADYASAWEEWEDDGQAEAWAVVSGDGLTDAAR
ncbi:MAG: antitoxin [Brachybacterium sp.]|nr:antitoxin [Brachybacterium sp.]